MIRKRRVVRDRKSRCGNRFWMEHLGGVGGTAFSGTLAYLDRVQIRELAGVLD